MKHQLLKLLLDGALETERLENFKASTPLRTQIVAERDADSGEYTVVCRNAMMLFANAAGQTRGFIIDRIRDSSNFSRRTQKHIAMSEKTRQGMPFMIAAETDLKSKGTMRSYFLETA